MDEIPDFYAIPLYVDLVVGFMFFGRKNCPRTRIDRFGDNMAQLVSQNGTIWTSKNFLPQKSCQKKQQPSYQVESSLGSGTK